MKSANTRGRLGPGDVEARCRARLRLPGWPANLPRPPPSIETALKLDPNLSPIDRLVAGASCFFFNGENDRAIAALERARE